MPIDNGTKNTVSMSKPAQIRAYTTQYGTLESGSIDIRNLTNDDEVQSDVSPNSGTIQDFEFLDDNTIASVCDDGEIVIWEADTGTVLDTLTKHSDNAIEHIELANKAEIAVTVDSTGDCIFWDINSPYDTNKTWSSDYDITRISYSEDGETLMAYNSDNDAVIWKYSDESEFNTITDIQDGGHNPRYIAMGGRGMHICYISTDDSDNPSISVMDVNGDSVAGPQGMHEHFTYDGFIRESPSGTMFLTGGKDSCTAATSQGYYLKVYRYENDEIQEIDSNYDCSEYYCKGKFSRREDRILVYNTSGGNLLNAVYTTLYLNILDRSISEAGMTLGTASGSYERSYRVRKRLITSEYILEAGFWNYTEYPIEDVEVSVEDEASGVTVELSLDESSWNSSINFGSSTVYDHLESDTFYIRFSSDSGASLGEDSFDLEITADFHEE